MNQNHATAETAGSSDTFAFIFDYPCTGPFPSNTTINIPVVVVTTNPITGRPEIHTSRPGR